MLKFYLVLCYQQDGEFDDDNYCYGNNENASDIILNLFFTKALILTFGTTTQSCRANTGKISHTISLKVYINFQIIGIRRSSYKL